MHWGKVGHLATAYKRKEYLKKVFNIVEPVEFVLDHTKEQVLSIYLITAIVAADT